MKRNPKVYHGSREHIKAWVASTSREFRSWETFGTFFTTDKDHARIFGKVVHELDLHATALRLFEAVDLWTPLLYPALHGIIPVKMKASERKVARLVFIGNDKTGEGPLIEKWHEIKTLWRNAQKSNRWHDIPMEHRKRLRLRSEAIDDALDVMRKFGHDPKYVAAMMAYFAEEGFDGFYWPNADHDVPSDAKGEPKYRHDVYFLFHPEKQLPGTLANPNLGNTGKEFRQHATLRILQDRIEKDMGKQLTLDQVRDLIRAMERDLRMKAFRVIEGTKRRANPMSLRAVDALVSLCKRKWGGQAAGWAADFANICRRGTPQKRLWAQVAQSLKREMYANPRPKRRTR